MSQTVTINPHHPDCRSPRGPSMYGGDDPERCCYCAALMRQAMFSSAQHEDPLDYRYGGPGCGCGPARED